MFQIFPHNGLFADHLSGSLAVVHEEKGSVTYLSGPQLSIFTGHPHAFDADSRTTESPLVHISITSGGEPVGFND